MIPAKIELDNRFAKDVIINDWTIGNDCGWLEKHNGKCFICDNITVKLDIQPENINDLIDNLQAIKNTCGVITISMKKVIAEVL